MVLKREKQILWGPPFEDTQALPECLDLILFGKISFVASNKFRLFGPNRSGSETMSLSFKKRGFPIKKSYFSNWQSLGVVAWGVGFFGHQNSGGSRPRATFEVVSYSCSVGKCV